jgi:hypothetical protein
MQHPRLNLGIVGFTPQHQALIAAQLSLNRAQPVSQDAYSQFDEMRHPVWQITHFSEANALLLNAQAMASSNQYEVRFHTDTAQGDIVGLRPSELALPCAVVGQLDPAVQALMPAGTPHTVLSDPRSIIQTLQYFEASLRPLRTLYALALQLSERQDELDNKHTYHLEHQSVLQAIVDVPRQRVMVRESLRPFNVDDAAWLSRPASANNQPAGFMLWMVEELMWILALHGSDMPLPERYFVRPVHLRRMPRVRSSLLVPRHAVLLKLLSQRPWHWLDLAAALGAQTDAQKKQLQRDMYALYICHTITTQPRSNPAVSTRPGNLTSEGEGEHHLPTMTGDLI